MYKIHYTTSEENSIFVCECGFAAQGCNIPYEHSIPNVFYSMLLIVLYLPSLDFNIKKKKINKCFIINNSLLFLIDNKNYKSLELIY